MRLLGVSLSVFILLLAASSAHLLQASDIDDGPKVRIGTNDVWVNSELADREQALSAAKDPQAIAELNRNIQVLSDAHRSYLAKKKPPQAFLSVKKMPTALITKEILIRVQEITREREAYYNSSNPKLHEDEIEKLKAEIVTLRKERDSRNSVVAALPVHPTYGPDDSNSSSGKSAAQSSF